MEGFFLILNGYEDIDRNMFFKFKEGCIIRRHKVIGIVKVGYEKVLIFSEMNGTNCQTMM